MSREEEIRTLRAKLAACEVANRNAETEIDRLERAILVRDQRRAEPVDPDHWKARALDAESKVDGQAWVDLTAERDALADARLRLIDTARAEIGALYVIEAAKAWREHWRDVIWMGSPDALDRIKARDAAREALESAVDALNRGNPDLYGPSTVSDPCPVCGQDNWPAGSAGNARRIHELAEHEGDPRIEPRWWQKHDAEPGPDLRLTTEAEADEQAAKARGTA